jgi:hypothetical protein
MMSPLLRAKMTTSTPRVMPTKNIEKQKPTKNTPARWRRKRRGGANGGECRGSASIEE